MVRWYLRKRTRIRLTFLQDVGGGVSPSKQNGDATRHELLRVAVAKGPNQHAVAVSIPLPVKGFHSIVGVAMDK